MTAVVEMMPPETAPVPLPAGDGVVWPEAFAELFALVAGEFAQAPSRRRARGYLLGLLSHSERKNGWTIAEFAGDAGPEGMQRLLNFYAWDEDKVRDSDGVNPSNWLILARTYTDLASTWTEGRKGVGS